MKFLIATLLIGFGLCILPSKSYADARIAGPSDVQVQGADPSSNTYIGMDYRPRNYTTYAGGIYSLNGHLFKGGLFAFGNIGGGQYSYVINPIQGKVRASIFDTSAGLGYLYFPSKTWWVSGYAGPQYHIRALNIADPYSNVTGAAKVGVQIGSQFNGMVADRWCFNGLGQFSTIEHASYCRLRTGYRFSEFGNLIAGPEGVYSGDFQRTEWNYGGFIALPVANYFDVSLSCGFADYQITNVVGTNKACYATISISKSF